jgi:hypothetical protein
MTDAVKTIAPQSQKAEASQKAPKSYKGLPAYMILFFVSAEIFNTISQAINIGSKEVEANAKAQQPINSILKSKLPWVQVTKTPDPVTAKAYFAKINAANKIVANEQQSLLVVAASIRQNGETLMGSTNSEVSNLPQQANILNGLLMFMEDIDQANQQMAVTNLQ